MVGFTLTLGFASCLRDLTDKTQEAVPSTGTGCDAPNPGREATPLPAQPLLQGLRHFSEHYEHTTHLTRKYP